MMHEMYAVELNFLNTVLYHTADVSFNVEPSPVSLTIHELDRQMQVEDPVTTLRRQRVQRERKQWRQQQQFLESKHSMDATTSVMDRVGDDSSEVWKERVPSSLESSSSPQQASAKTVRARPKRGSSHRAAVTATDRDVAQRQTKRTKQSRSSSFKDETVATTSTPPTIFTHYV
jgi:hypothetical protein